uniref:Uncharacterized protein n=1 Tax=viral metagenome TaxID=1070528 RepID=A0A6C0LLX4_9ZZZZ
MLLLLISITTIVGIVVYMLKRAFDEYIDDRSLMERILDTESI